jgi:taurine--2-oxoglutarate transaminase
VVRAIQEQAAQLCFAHPGMATEPRGLLGQKIAAVAPGDLNKTFFCLGGAEANENAIKMARMYTGRFKVMARYRSYHGATHGAIALTGDYRRLPVEPAMPGVVHFLDPYCYRCPFGWTRDTCHRECISHVEEIISYEGPENIAAIFMEGVTGSNGLLVPPDDYWPRIREICDRHGILLVSDEVMSGWGRTGEWFAVDHWGVVPDMITTAKGLTAGYVPLGAVIVSEAIAEYFDYRERGKDVFDGLVEYHQMSFDLINRGEPDRVNTGVVSANFFQLLGIKPIVGRDFETSDDVQGAEAVLILSNTYWRQRFGGAPISNP